MIDLKQNKAFCILPFVHLHVSERNDVKLCCLAEDDLPIKKYSTDFDFANDPELESVRARLLAGERVPHCKKCYEYEDGGAESTRIRDTAEWAETLSLDNIADIKPDLVYYDIRNDNLCNLSCRMCSPRFSSQIVKEYKQLGWLYEDEPKSFSFNNVVDMDTVKKIYVAGGEPSLMPEFRIFLKRAIAAGRTNIDIRMNTNATNLNQEYRELLSHFANLNIVCSIDGYDQVNRYIRWPADWPTLVENIKGLAKITDHIAFNVTVSIWNIARLSELVEFFEATFERPTILLNHVMSPDYERFEYFPDKTVALTDLVRIKRSRSFQTDLSFQSKVQYLIRSMKDSHVDVSVLKEFFKYNDALDQARGVKLADYIPELEAGRSLCT